MSLTMALTREQMLIEMDKALAEEIAKQSNSNRAHRIATDGKQIPSENGQFIYVFTLDEPWPIQDDAPLKIANPSGKEIKCSVVNAIGMFITISADKPLPEDLLQRIEFLDDSTELLRRQQEALTQAQESEGQLASKSFGLIPYQTITISGVEPKLSGKTSLRVGQRTAISKALGGEVAFIVGPPGTGKTLTLAAIAFTHLREGRTVLIAAHTNIAIDNAIMKLCELCEEAERAYLLEQGQVIRLGTAQQKDLTDSSYYQKVSPSSIAQRLNEQLRREYDQCTRDLSKLKEHIQELLKQRQVETQQYQQALEQCKIQSDQLHDSLQSLKAQERQRQEKLQAQQKQYRSELQQLEHAWTEASQRLAQVKAVLVEQRNAHTRAKQQEQESLQRLVDARAMNGVQRFFHGINLEKLEKQVGEAAYQANQLLLSVQIAQNDETRYQEKMSTLKPRVMEYQEKIRQVDQQLNPPSAQAVDVDIARLQSELTQVQRHYQQQKNWLDQAKQLHQPELQALSKQQQQLETQLGELAERMRNIEKKIVENARVVGTTLTRTFMNQAVSSRHFDAVILDEVSMAPMPLIYLAATHADRSITFIGDPQQLAPIAMAKTELTTKWLKNDLFSFRNISLEAASGGLHHSALLDVQSRMHPQIARIANTLVYGGKIKDAFKESMLKPQILPLLTAPLVLCDTQDAAPTVSRPKNGRSRRNYYHALCCLELAKKVRQRYPDITLGIATPYAPQAKLINKLIKETQLQEVRVDTIHRFQGLEFDVVIFDTVESPGIAPGDFISGSFGSDTMRLINVAVTRPRCKLFIVAHQQHILRTFPEGAIMKKVVQLAANAEICPSLDIVGTSLATVLREARTQRISPEWHLNQLLARDEEILVLHPAEETESEEISHYNEKTFYDACKRDIRAANEIIIASPFLTPTRVKEMLPVLLEKQRQGVEITIYTKPLQECKAWHGEAAKILLDAGLQPSYRPEMHQKAIILDGKILYHGSLNILSQYKSGESMLRLKKHPQLIEALKEELQTPVITSQKTRTMTEDEVGKLKAIPVSIRLLPALTSTCACGSRFVLRLRKDGSGAFYGCENFSKCSPRKIIKIAIDHLQQIPTLQNRKCTQCGGILELQHQEWPQLFFFSCENQCEEKQRVVFTH